MKLLTTLSSFVLALSSVQALPLQERQNGIVYLQAKTNVASRLEIRQLHDTQPAQYNLFIVALNRWMSKPQSDPTSYFGIAAIHGVPQATYNGANGANQNCGQACSGADGYAVHDSVLFPTWHRAYIALFEQELTKVAKAVANEYPEAQRKTYQKAANALRLPYYDAGARPKQGSPAFPNLMTDFTVVVNGPKGRTSLNNPLFRFHIQDPSGFRYQYFTTWDRTLRYPSSNAANAASNTAASKNALANLRQGVADQLYGLFVNCHDWLHFSNDRAGSSIPSCATSVEDIHNGIHTAIGGPVGGPVSPGHMTYLPTSSFDPSFWLHHANIDRMFAFWQTLNPNSWGNNQITPTASWTIGVGQNVNAESGLTPFMRQQGGNSQSLWTSNQVRNWRNLGYTYPEYAHSSGSAQDITGYINRLYGPNANAVAGSSKRDLLGDTLGAAGDIVGDTVSAVTGESDTTSAAAATSQSGDNSLLGAVGSIINDTLTGVTSTAQSIADPLLKIGSPLVASNGSVFQYVANIYTPRYLLNGTYQVYLFNGEPTATDPSQFIAQENLIGMMGVLSKPGMTDNPTIASGSIPLTRTLQNLTPAFGGLNLLQDLSEALVVPFLTKNLVWKVVGLNGIVDPGTIPGFVVSIYASTAPQVAEDQLPIWSDFVPLLDVTKDQSGGANTTAQLLPPQQIVSAISSLL